VVIVVSWALCASGKLVLLCSVSDLVEECLLPLVSYIIIISLLSFSRVLKLYPMSILHITFLSLINLSLMVFA
jgi:hypothetical protein